MAYKKIKTIIMHNILIYYNLDSYSNLTGILITWVTLSSAGP